MHLYRISFRSSQDGVDVVNTLHAAAHSDAPEWIPSSPDMTPALVASEIDTQLTTLYRAILHQTATLHDITVVEEFDPLHPDLPRAAAVVSKELAGTRTSSFSDLPVPTCAILQLRTASIGRSFRGRQFMPPAMVTQDLSDGVFNDTSNYITAINAYRAKLDNTFGTGSTWSTLWTDTAHVRLGVYSRTRRARGADSFFAPITATAVDRKAHWLRSRAQGGR